MGLFSGIGKILKAAAPVIGTAIGGPLGGAIGGGVSALLGGSDNKNALNGANAATQLGLTNAENALNTQYGQTSANLTPWITGGQQAFGQEGNLLGLNGNGTQASSIAALQASPLFQSLYRQGQDTILNNASATGGLRGGNTQSSLANFGSDTLAQVIQSQLQNLAGVSQQGQSAAGQLGQFGAQNAGSIADLLVGSGKANAGTILNGQAVNNNTNDQLTKLFGGSGVQDQVSGLLQSLGIGGGQISPAAANQTHADYGYQSGSNIGSALNLPNINIALPNSISGLPGF